MKQFILKSFCVFFAFMMLNMQTFAYTLSSAPAITENEIQTLTQFDDSEVYAAFDEVIALDQYLTLNDGKTYADISKENGTILNGVSAATSLPSTSSGNDSEALGIPSFLWGCVLGVVGMLIVYLITEDKEETKKALWGCLISTAVSIALYVVVITASASTGGYYY